MILEDLPVILRLDDLPIILEDLPMILDDLPMILEDLPIIPGTGRCCGREAEEPCRS